MSVKMSHLVWERLGLGGGELLLALALADCSDDLGGSLFPSVRRLARKTRQSERTVRRQLKRFRKIGWLQVVKAGGLRGEKRLATRYQINPIWVTGMAVAGIPEAEPVDVPPLKITPAILSGVGSNVATGGIRPLSPVTATPDTAVSQYPSGSINDPKSARARTNPTGSRGARKEAPHAERVAAARALLAQVPDYPLASLAKMYSLTDEDLALVTASSATYAAAEVT
jgi:hypothetical protein